MCACDALVICRPVFVARCLVVHSLLIQILAGDSYPEAAPEIYMHSKPAKFDFVDQSSGRVDQRMVDQHWSTQRDVNQRTIQWALTNISSAMAQQANVPGIAAVPITGTFPRPF